MSRSRLSATMLALLCSQPVWVVILPTGAEAHQQARDAFFKQATYELCPPADAAEASHCFVRQFLLQGDWAMVRLAMHNADDALVIYRRSQGHWVKTLDQPAPDWQAAQDAGLSISAALYRKLSRKLFPEQEANS
ncbi:MAG TPA: hypothetical protein V6D23_13645 [Candidatus Obscuribacterales bacterium]